LFVTFVRRTLAAAAATALVALGPAAAFGETSASVGPAMTAASGKPGYCTDDAGVTVVVDFSALGGDVVVRCAAGPGGQGFSGLDALDAAGFSVTGTQRWGMQFVCRIQGRPTAREDLAIPGDDSYHEDCGDTPPEAAYWGYWYASNGGSWRYSSISAASRTTIRGGFEGWSFHLGSSSAKPPPIAPRHAVSAPTSSPPPSAPGGQHSHGGQSAPSSPPSSSATSSPTAAAPTTADPSALASGQPRHRRHPGSDTDAPARSTTEPPGKTAPADTARQADGPQVVTAVPQQPAGDDGGSARPFLVGAGVLVLLGAGAGTTAWRRSHRG
jgi:hypothetical protein